MVQGFETGARLINAETESIFGERDGFDLFSLNFELLNLERNMSIKEI